MFERYYSFLHYCLFCRYVMFQKCIPSKPKRGSTSSRWGGGGYGPPTVATTLRSTLIRSCTYINCKHFVEIFATSRKHISMSMELRALNFKYDVT